MFKSSHTKLLYQEFIKDYQQLRSNHPQNSPFVYVDPAGVIKLLTNVVGSDEGGENDIFGVSIAENGWMEFLSIND